MIPEQLVGAVDEVDLHGCSLSRTASWPTDLEAATGWTLKPEGLCRGDVCVPVRDRDAFVDADGRVDARRPGPRARACRGRRSRTQRWPCWATARPNGDTALESLEAPDVALPGLDGQTHQLSEWRHRKRAIVAWASWCGCRYEIAAWQALRDELAPTGFEVLGISLDDDVEAARPWVEAAEPHPEFPVLVDPDHRIAELYGVVNVPSVVWIDEDDRVVRPAGDRARSTTSSASSPRSTASVHHDQLRQLGRSRHAALTTPTRRRDHVDAAHRGAPAGPGRAAAGRLAAPPRRRRGRGRALRPGRAAGALRLHHRARLDAAAWRRSVRRRVLPVSLALLTITARPGTDREVSRSACPSGVQDVHMTATEPSPQAQTGPGYDKPTMRQWITLGIVLMSTVIVVLDNTVLNVAIPTILHEFHTTLPSLEWVITGYSLTFATFLIIGGRLGDIYGQRRVFVIGAGPVRRRARCWPRCRGTWPAWWWARPSSKGSAPR